MANQLQSPALQFKIKLLSGNNVAMVECVGYESQLFIPQIINGLISFQNIIPKNRCCNAATTQAQTDHLILPTSKFGNVRILPSNKYNDGSNNYNLSAPLARSTPATGPTMRSTNRIEKENVPLLLTPELQRCRPTQLMSSLTSIEVDDIQSPLETSTAPHLPELQLTASGGDHTPRRSTAGATLSNMANPHMRHRFASTPNSPTSVSTPESTLGKAPPVRTYSRRGGKSSSKSTASISWSPLPKKKRLTQVSSTKAPSPGMKVEVRHRKLIVDQKKTLPKQDAPKPKLQVSKTRILSKQVSAKTRQQFEALKMTAFDLLTTPGTSHLSEDLRKEFKNACVDRYSEAVPNYAELAVVPPLEHDRQVKALLAQRKRLEKRLTKSEQVRLLREKRI